MLSRGSFIEGNNIQFQQSFYLNENVKNSHLLVCMTRLTEALT